MPLIKTVLETGIKTRIKALEPKFIKSLDGGPLSVQIANAETIYDALGNIRTKCQALGAAGAYSEIIVKQITSNEWSNAIAKQVIDLLADEVSKIVADEVDKYIKSATVIVPPGQALYAGDSTGGGPGATTAPSPPALIS
jgi:oligoendopeptidase F